MKLRNYILAIGLSVFAPFISATNLWVGFGPRAPHNLFQIVLAEQVP